MLLWTLVLYFLQWVNICYFGYLFWCSVCPVLASAVLRHTPVILGVLSHFVAQDVWTPLATHLEPGAWFLAVKNGI